MSRTLLEPLLMGRTVTLSVNDPRLPRKRRVNTITLYLQLVGEGKNLLIGLPGYGCEVLPVNEIKPMAIMRVGLSAHASKILCNALNELFQEHHRR